MKTIWILISVLSLSFGSCSPSKDILEVEITNEEDILASNIQLADQTGEKMPILAWVGIRSTEVPPNVYQDFVDAGFTINMGGDLRWGDNAFKYTPKMLFDALDNAVIYGFKQVITSNFLDALSAADIEKLKVHPGLAGYFVYDEPTTYEKLAEIKPIVNKVKSLGGNNFPYVNLASADCRGANWAPALIGCTGVEPSPYASFVKKFDEELDLPMISMDNYPIYYDAAANRRFLKPGWMYSLEVTSKEAKAKNKELWAFALSSAHSNGGFNFPIPTKNDLRLQMFANLAYGAQCLQYYTYGDMSTSTTSNYPMTPITVDGTKTPVYYIVKEMNEEIKGLSPVFLNAKMEWVAHTGIVPDGTTELDKSKLPSVFKSLDIKGGSGALVSLMSKGEDNFLIVMNRNIEDNLYVTATGTENLYRVNKKSQPVLLGTGTRKLDPGDMLIYFWKN